MKINKITLIEWLGTFDEKEYTILDSSSHKPINIIYMPNSSWKSLIFNALEHLFSFNKKPFIKKKTNESLGIIIDFNLEGKNYVFSSNINQPYKVTYNWTPVEDFDKILSENIGLSEWKLKYYWKDKNTLSWINRFSFLDSHWINDKEEKNIIPFIDTWFDGDSRKIILSYILWNNINSNLFEKVTEYEHIKNYIDKNKKFQKYEEIENTSNLINSDIHDLYKQLSELRWTYWDILMASKQLKFLKEDYIKTIWKEDEDYAFLKEELNKIELLIPEINKDIADTKNSISDRELVEKKWLFENWTLANKEMSKYNKYLEYKERLNSINKEELEFYITSNIEPKIEWFKKFISFLYDDFIKSCIKYWVLKKDEIITPENSIIFNETKLNIEANFKTSEWIRKTIRVLTFIGLHLYSNVNNNRCLNISFYDSFIENIDYTLRAVLFDSLFNHIESNNYMTPEMFLFITKVEKNKVKTSINEIVNKFNEKINLIDVTWLRWEEL